MNIGDRIKQKRLENKMTLEDLGKRADVNKATIQRYESGKITNIPSDRIERISEALGVSPAYLMGWEDSVEVLGYADISYQYPFIESIAAGSPLTIEAIVNAPTITLPNYLLGKYANNKNIMIMKVNGSSMDRLFPDGSLIAVLRNYDVENLNNGDIVVFQHDYEYSVKHFYNYSDKIVFRPNSSNEVFTDIVFKKDDSLNVEIIGKVVMYNVVLD